jgi:PAS domain-containing protein
MDAKAALWYWFRSSLREFAAPCGFRRRKGEDEREEDSPTCEGGASMPEKGDKSKAQKAAEANVESFREDLGPFVVAAETTRMAMVFTDAKDPNHPIIFANDAFLSLTGYHREEVLGQSFNF